MKTTRTIKVISVTSSMPQAIYMDRFLLLRKPIGQNEVVNMTQLGRLNDAKKQGCVDFIFVD